MEFYLNLRQGKHLRVYPIEALHDNYIWTIVNHDTRECVVVDPGEATGILTFIDQHKLTLRGILITHHHWDHTNGIADVLSQYRVPVYAGAKEPVDPKDYALKNEDVLNIESMGLSLQVIEIPGHTLGHVAFYGHEWLFSGDTLFTAGCGRVFEGTALQMLTSLMKLAALPKETRVYCGHEYTLANLTFAREVEPENAQIEARMLETQSLRGQGQPSVPAQLSLELETNPFLRCHLPGVIKGAERHCGQRLDDSVEVFSVIRKWKNSL